MIEYQSEKAYFVSKIDLFNQNYADFDEIGETDEEGIYFENNLVEEANSNLNSILIISTLRVMEIVNPIAELFEGLVWGFGAENAAFMNEIDLKPLRTSKIRKNLQIVAEFGLEHTKCGRNFLNALVAFQHNLRDAGDYLDLRKIDQSFVKTVNDFLFEKMLIDRAIENYCAGFLMTKIIYD